MAGIRSTIDGIEISATAGKALDAVAERQLANGEGPTVDSILLEWPHESVETVRTSIRELIDHSIVTTGTLATGQVTLHVGPRGLLASHLSGRASEVAEAMLRFFQQRMSVDRADAFRGFDWSELKRHGIGKEDADLPFVRVIIQTLDLAQERVHMPGKPDAHWDVPSDLVELRDLHNVADLYARAEQRRVRHDEKSPAPQSRASRSRPRSNSTVADAIGFAHVLVVGVAEYKPASNFQRLRQCVFDAQEVAACFRLSPELHSSSDRIHELTSGGAERPSRGNIFDQVRALASRATAEDRIVFFYSGHGQRIDNKLYLVPEDAWADDDPNALVSLDTVNEFLSNSLAKIKVVILDACNTGPSLSDLKHPATKWSEHFLAEYIHKSHGVVTLASSLEDQSSSTKSPDRDLSLFTHFVVNALRGAPDSLDDGFLTVESLFEYVSAHVQRVSKSHHREQQPAMNMASSGMIVLGDFRKGGERHPPKSNSNNGSSSAPSFEEKGRRRWWRSRPVLAVALCLFFLASGYAVWRLTPDSNSSSQPQITARSLSSESIALVASELRLVPQRETLDVAWVVGDAESEALAKDLARAFNVGGWSLTLGPVMYTESIGTGIVFFVRDKNDPPSTAKRISSVLTSNGLATHFVSNPSFTADMFKLTAGSRPLSQ